jgi:hypothetical protein
MPNHLLPVAWAWYQQVHWPDACCTPAWRTRQTLKPQTSPDLGDAAIDSSGTAISTHQAREDFEQLALHLRQFWISAHELGDLTASLLVLALRARQANGIRRGEPLKDVWQAARKLTTIGPDDGTAGC